FIRDARGNIVTFDPPGSTFTDVKALNDAGVAAGVYEDASSHSHGFIRDAGGNITTFDPPGGSGIGSVTALNDHGQVAGSYSHRPGLPHAFTPPPPPGGGSPGGLGGVRATPAPASSPVPAPAPPPQNRTITPSWYIQNRRFTSSFDSAREAA